jgi:hypothetical protein
MNRASPGLQPTSRSVARVLRVCAFAAALPACVLVDHTHGAGANAPIPSAGTPVFRLQPNAPTGIMAGTQAGYGIRTLNGTNTLRIIWTGDAASGGGYHEFYGTIWTTGHFSNQVLGCTANFCPLESGDFVSAPYATTGGQRIDWDTFASDGLDGFEVTTDQYPVYVDFYIDGVHYPNLVSLPDGSNNGTLSSVTAIPFGVTAP